MKAIAVQQPWASLICSGIKDVENRTWKPSHMGRTLIVASSKKVTKSFMDQLPLFWYSEVFNHELYGNIDLVEDLPVSAVVGYVDIVDCEERTDSLWDGGPGCYKWILENAYIFDEPQLVGIKSKLHFFDIPEIDEHNLPPAHKVELRQPSIEGSMIILPLVSEEFNAIEQNKDEDILLELSEHIYNIFDGVSFDDLKQLKIVSSDGSSSIYKIECIEEVTMLNSDGQPIYENDEPWNRLRIQRGAELA